ncbi:MAG: hypothetical protein WBN40_03640 [Pseudomonadales bacterium]
MPIGDSGLDGVNAGSAISIDGDLSYALSLSSVYENFGEDYTDIELHVARYKSQLNVRDRSSGDRARSDLDVYHLHAGGNYHFDSAAPVTTYLGLTAGVSRLDASGYDALTRASFGFAAGAQIPLHRSVALRLDLRAIGVLLRSDAKIFCAGGCVATLSSDVWWQYAASAAWVIRF